MTGAKERLFDLVFYDALPGTSEQVQQALIERGDAHAEWRTAHARAAILIPANEPLDAAIEHFRIARDAADAWVVEYQRLGSTFSFADHKGSEQEAWKAMRRARHDLIAAGQAIALSDASWLPLLRKQRSRRNHRRLASLAAARSMTVNVPTSHEHAPAAGDQGDSVDVDQEPDDEDDDPLEDPEAGCPTPSRPPSPQHSKDP